MADKTPEPEFNPFATPAAAPTVKVLTPEIRLQQYSLVRIGLQLIYYSIVTTVFLFALVVIVFFGIGILSSPVSPGGGILGISMMAVGLGIMAAVLAMIVGFCMCLAAPNSNEKPLAIICVVCLFLGMGMAFASGLLEGAMAESTLSSLLDVGGNIASCISTVVFCLFLKRIGENISSAALQKSAKSALGWFGLTIAALLVGAAIAWGFAMSVSTNALPSVMPVVGIIFGLVMIVLGLGGLFAFIAMLRTGAAELKPNYNG